MARTTCLLNHMMMIVTLRCKVEGKLFFHHYNLIAHPLVKYLFCDKIDPFNFSLRFIKHSRTSLLYKHKLERDKFVGYNDNKRLHYIH